MIFSLSTFCIRNNFDLSCPVGMSLILLKDTRGDWKTDETMTLNTKKCKGTNI